MSGKSRRKPNIPPRPQLVSEQMRTAMTQAGSTQRVLDRQQCMEFAVMLAANLAHLLNNKAQLPWLTTSIDKRSDGFSLHVQVLPVISDSDAVI